MASPTHLPKPSGPPTGTLVSLFGSGQRLSFAKGEIVLRPDDKPPGIFYIESGYVKVLSTNDRGEEYLHLIYGPREFFPIIWAIAEHPLNLFYKAIAACVLLRVPTEKFMKDIKTDAKLSFTVLEQVVKQFDVYTHRVDNLEYKYGRERLAYRLLYLASRFGDRSGGKITLPPITQQDIASSINLSRESASREIERLESRGLVSYDGRSISINDVRALSQEVKGIDTAAWGLS